MDISHLYLSFFSFAGSKKLVLIIIVNSIAIVLCENAMIMKMNVNETREHQNLRAGSVAKCLPEDQTKRYPL